MKARRAFGPLDELNIGGTLKIDERVPALQAGHLGTPGGGTT
jgi:hypothetical protein